MKKWKQVNKFAVNGFYGYILLVFYYILYDSIILMPTGKFAMMSRSAV